MLELHNQTIPNVYFELFPFLLMPTLWERPGYIPALVRLLQVYIEKGANTVITEKIVINNNFFSSLKLLKITIMSLILLKMPVLGVFQRLVASKTNDQFAFYILNSLTEHLPR